MQPNSRVYDMQNDNFRYKSGEPITIKLSIDHDRKVAVSVDLPDGVNETGAFHEWGRPSEEVIFFLLCMLF